MCILTILWSIAALCRVWYSVSVRVKDLSRPLSSNAKCQPLANMSSAKRHEKKFRRLHSKSANASVPSFHQTPILGSFCPFSLNSVRVDTNIANFMFSEIIGMVEDTVWPECKYIFFWLLQQVATPTQLLYAYAYLYSIKIIALEFKQT